MLTLQQYAEAKEVDQRTVKRWLSAGELPGAIKDEDSGKWSIPADARRTKGHGLRATPVPDRATAEVTELVVHRHLTPSGVVPFDGAPTPTPLLDRLQDLPAYLTVAQAAEFLGVPRAQIAAHPETFDAVPVGVAGSLRVPQATVRRIAGIAAS